MYKNDFLKVALVTPKIKLALGGVNILFSKLIALYKNHKYKKAWKRFFKGEI